MSSHPRVWQSGVTSDPWFLLTKGGNLFGDLITWLDIVGIVHQQKKANDS